MKSSSPGSSARAFAGRFAIALVVGSLLMTAAVAGVDREVDRKLDRIPKIELTTAPVPPGGANYLLVGSDTREFVSNELEAEAFGDAESESGRRSDTIMVVHVEPKAERTFIVSFPRDLWVNIPNHGMAKINGAYNYDAQTVIDTLKQNFDVDVNHYIEVNFKTFVELVDSLGRVTVYTPYPARDEYTGLDLPNPGCVALDGEQSLQWVRSRYLEYENGDTGRWVSADIIPDLGRIGRQQEFMRELAGLAVQKSLDNPFTANLVADKVVNGLHVDDAFDKSSVFALLDAFRTLNPDDQSALEFVTLPSRPGPPQQGQSVLYANSADPLFDEIIQRLRTFDERPRPTPRPSEIRVRVVNASGRDDLGIAVKQTLSDLGFVVTEVVENPKVRIPGTTVRFAPGQNAKAKLMLRFLQPTPALDVHEMAIPDADIEIVLAKTFEAVAVPADFVPVTEPAPVTDVPAEPVPEAETPLETSVTTTTLPANLPEPAPRVGC